MHTYIFGDGQVIGDTWRHIQVHPGTCQPTNSYTLYRYNVLREFGVTSLHSPSRFYSMELSDHYYICTTSCFQFIIAVTEELLYMNGDPRPKDIHWMRICSWSSCYSKNIASPHTAFLICHTNSHYISLRSGCGFQIFIALKTTSPWYPTRYFVCTYSEVFCTRRLSRAALTALSSIHHS